MLGAMASPRAAANPASCNAAQMHARTTAVAAPLVATTGVSGFVQQHQEAEAE